jgi:RNA polymerase sigma-70 factor (ECF subfamily)
MRESKLDDVSLIKRIAQAQNDAISELYDHYNRLVFSVAFAILGDRAIAEEVTLDVFVHVWRKAGTYRPDRGKVSTWLIAITRHQAIDVLRWQNSRARANSLNWDEMSLPDGQDIRDQEESIEISLQRERVRKAVAQLPADQRQALALAYFRGYTHLQIAKELNQPLGTIKTRVRLAMKKLRRLLQEDQFLDKSESASVAYPIDKKQ